MVFQCVLSYLIFHLNQICALSPCVRTHIAQQYAVNSTAFWHI